ncbi:hypothetical protein NPS45_18985, partial [Pseudomonas putida]|nr:hypothetical protein [Pseudomonas putida]
ALFAYEIERRPRGASRAALAPTFVFGQERLLQARATALFLRCDLEPYAKAFARKWHRNNWPETNVGASAARDAPRGRRSICATPQKPRRAPGCRYAVCVRQID